MIDVVNKGIYVKLNGTSAVTTLLSGATAIYFSLAPLEAALPYIVYSIAGGGSENESPLDAVDLRYLVKGVATTATRAGALAGAIRTALHEPASMAFDSPWFLVRCQETEAVDYTETTERVQYWHAGGLYRLRLSK